MTSNVRFVSTDESVILVTDMVSQSHVPTMDFAVWGVMPNHYSVIDPCKQHDLLLYHFVGGQIHHVIMSSESISGRPNDR